MTVITSFYESLPYTIRKGLRDALAIAVPIAAGGIAAGQPIEEIASAVVLAVAGLFGWRITRKSDTAS